MEFTDIQILGCKVAKKVSMNYYHPKEGLNYNVDDGEYPHPDLVEAVLAFRNHLAESHYIVGGEQDYFKPQGFVIHEDKEVFSIVVTGKLTTLEGDVVPCKSGKINTAEDSEIENKLATLREELFAYFFRGKSAQGDLFEDVEKKEEDK